MAVPDEPEADAEESQPIRLLLEMPSTSYDNLIVRYPYQRDDDYALAYHESANRLASTFRGNPIDDTILLPFLLLYRHAYELRLKHVIKYLARTRRRYREPDNPKLAAKTVARRLRFEHGHKLQPLLDELLEHFNALELEEEFPAEVISTIALLHEADSTGMSFRYARQLPDTQENADFPALAKLLDEQLNMLAVTEDYVEGLFEAVPDDYMY
ncbi:hypothetical protein AB6N24_08685 [Cellulomonas sp. 179-A 4D5 NHS]|uniref:hypothetical protein n=1 Tax=Cellulomonas sp. 179-A 4D5 NHS TaxID=3142378 RepID=UPI0039A19CF9